MNAKIYGVLGGLALLAPLPAAADYVIKDGNSILRTMVAGTLSGKILPQNQLVDASGLATGVPLNPLAMSFGSGVLLPSFAAPQHFICDSGCGGGGGGGGGLSVPFAGPIGANGTPVGFKDASGNLQPLLGDTTNGLWVSIKASVPIAVTGTFWQATQPISAASLPLPTGAATQTTLASILTTLGTPFQAGGSIGNTSFGISGTLPAFASTPTFNLGTLNGAATAANQTAVTGSATGGIAAANSRLAGGVFNSVAPTLSNGQQAGLQLDASGYLRVNVMTGGGGSSPFGAAFPASGVALGMSQGGNLVGVTGTGGNLNVNCANCSGSGVSSIDKATFTAGSSLFAGGGGFFQTTATSNPLTNGQQGMFQVTAQRALFSNLRDATGTELGVAAAPLQVSLANTGANGTALLVTGTGGTFPVSQATAGNLNATVVGTGTFAVQASIASAASWGINTLGSATGGQSGQLALGAVTTAAPSYTTAQSNALSLTTAGALRVDGSGVTQPVSLTSTTITGTVAVTQSGPWSLAANQSVNVAQVNGAAVLTGSGAVGTGAQRIALGQDTTTIAGSAPGSAGAPSANVVSVQGVPGGTAVPTSLAAAASGGATPSFVVAANSNNSTSLKGSAGIVYSIQTSNINASTAYFIKLYDKAVAPTCGTDTPVAAYVIPPSNGGNNVTLSVGKQFTLGIGYCIVAGIANNDNTSVPAATILANIDWK